MLKFTDARTLSVRGAALPQSSTGESLLQLRSIEGAERLSEIYEYTLELVTPADAFIADTLAANLDLKAMIGKPLTVIIQLDGFGTVSPGSAGALNIGTGERAISGLVFEAKHVSQTNRQSHYVVKIRPWIELARNHTDYRIFQRQSVVGIIDSVLKGRYMYSYDKRLANLYPALDYQVQYGESDFAFIQRLMEENGIYWFFEHSNGFHRMVLVDQIGAHKPVQSAAYRTLKYYPPGYKIDEEYISRFDVAQILQPGAWTTDDYDFRQPRAKLMAQNELPQQTAHNDIERYEWPGDYADPKQGKAFALVRMQELRAQGERADGAGNVRSIVCGTVFELKGCPVNSANRKYLVLGATLSGKEIGDSTGTSRYSIATTFEVQPSTVMYRPPRTINKPRTTGPQTAIVTGPKGSEIWTNQFGQVKLSFHWDRSGVKDENSSCWVRVSYPWVGSNFGGVHVPRVGTEVIVDFENGDPDRPIVTGRVYNAATMPPWALPANATQSGILTRSSKDGGYENANAIRFEDRKGAEELWLQAERDMRTEVENDEAHAVRHDRMKTIENDESTTIGHDRTETVGHDEQVDIRHDRRHRIGEDAFLEVGRNHRSQVGKDRIEEVGNHRKDQIAANHSVEVGGHAEHTVQGHFQVEAGQAAGMKSRFIQLQAGEAAKISGPAGTITLDTNGITLEAVRITLKGPVQSSAGWVKNALDLRSDVREGEPFDADSFSFSG